MYVCKIIWMFYINIYIYMCVSVSIKHLWEMDLVSPAISSGLQDGPLTAYTTQSPNTSDAR